MRRTAMVICCIVVSAFAVTGCKSQPTMSKTPATGSYEEPKWVTKGVSAFPDELGKSLYGVGIAEKKRVPVISLQRVTAVEAARIDVARQLQTFVQGVFKDYSEAALTPKMDSAESQSLVESVHKTIVDETVIGVQPIDSWTHPATGDYYSLVKLNMDTVSLQLRQKISAVAAEKRLLRIDAAKAHKELDEIIAKNREALGR